MLNFFKRSKKHKPEYNQHIRSELGEFVGLENLEEARKDPEGYVIFQGDDGGQIYATIPAGIVKCSEEELNKILMKIDAYNWNEPRTASIYFEHGQPGTSIPGGMEGGYLDDKLWIHPRLENQDELADLLGRVCGLLEK